MSKHIFNVGRTDDPMDRLTCEMWLDTLIDGQQLNSDVMAKVVFPTVDEVDRIRRQTESLRYQVITQWFILFLVAAIAASGLFAP